MSRTLSVALSLLFSFACWAELPANAANWPNECQQGNKASCYYHAKRLKEGNQINKNLPDALKYFQKACDLGLIEGCGEVGKMLFFGGEGITRDEAAAIPFTAKTCGMGFSDQVCWITAYILMEGDGSVKHDPAKAQDYLSHGCAINDARACEYGALLYSGRLEDVDRLKHIAPDPKKTFMFANQGCANNSGIACGIAGLLFTGELGFEENLDKAMAYFHRGCEVGDGASCSNAANFQQKRDGGITDKNRDYLMMVSKRGCELDDASACYRVGRFNWLEGNKAESLSSFLKGCEGGIDRACFFASIYYNDIKNHSKSLELAQKGCKLSYQPSCDWAKELGGYLAEMQRLEAEENAKAAEVTAALNKNDYRAAIDIAVNRLRSRSQAARVILAAENAGRIGDIESVYFYNLINWFTYSHSTANAIVQREFKKIKKAEKDSQNYFRVAPVNSAYDKKAESLWETSKRNSAATEKRNMDWYNRGGQASADVQRRLGKR